MPQPFDYIIPIINSAENAGSYHDEPIDFTDPRAAEPLVNAKDYGLAGESFYARRDGENWPYNVPIEGATKAIWLRQGIAEKLVRVNALLATRELELFLYDVYRPVSCQRGMWKFFMEQLEREMPHATYDERRAHALNFYSDPTSFDPMDFKTWPIHSCGAAVDTGLRNKKTGEVLDMGARFDEMETVAYSDFFERQALAGEIMLDDPRLLNRRILHGAMHAEGFLNYHLEYWHFDFGDQMYVYFAKFFKLPDAPRAAWYGTMASPES